MSAASGRSSGGRANAEARLPTDERDEEFGGTDDALVLTGHSPSCEAWTDAALMAAVALRDGDAYPELYRRHVASVMAATRMILGSGSECDDVVTSVFLTLWMSPERFDPDRGSLLSYLRMSARGRSIDLLRAETSRRRREQGTLHALRTPSPDTDAALLAFEASAELRRAVAALPAGEREAIRLAYFGEMSYQSVGLFLNEPEGTVKPRIRSGLQRLRTSGALGLDRESVPPNVAPRVRRPNSGRASQERDR